jgi:hypothetical protein
MQLVTVIPDNKTNPIDLNFDLVSVLLSTQAGTRIIFRDGTDIFIRVRLKELLKCPAPSAGFPSLVPLENAGGIFFSAHDPIYVSPAAVTYIVANIEADAGCTVYLLGVPRGITVSTPTNEIRKALLDGPKGPK